MPSDKKLRVFLGGTVNGSTWRDELIPNLTIDYFNPVTDDWDEAARLREIEERKRCDYNLYILTPKMTGFYSIAEVVDDAYKKPGQTLFCFLNVDEDEKFTAAQLKSLRYLGKVVEQNGGIWCKSLDEVTTFFNKLQSKTEYYRIYQNILRRAVKWNRLGKTSSLLLRGFPLIDTRRWLKESEFGDVISPTELIRNYYTASEEEDLSSHKISAFISYARKPSLQFAGDLCNQLQLEDMNIWFDKHNIRAGVDFREEIKIGIEKAGNFIYIMTDDSVASPYCQMELDIAKQAGKRILPIQHGTVAEETIDQQIQPIHRLFFRNQEDLPQLVQELTSILNEGQDFIYDHTKFLQKAIAWKKEGRNVRMLLKKQELQEAVNWLTAATSTLTPANPSLLHCEYICESKKYEEQDFVDFWLCSDKKTTFENRLKYRLSLVGMTTAVREDEKDEELGILKSARFIFLISAASINSEDCLRELDLARKYCLPIIPVVLEETGVSELLSDQEKRALVDYSADINKVSESQLSSFVQDMLRKDVAQQKQFRFLRYRYALWEANGHGDAFLLGEYGLEYYQDWLLENRNLVGGATPSLPNTSMFVKSDCQHSSQMPLLPTIRKTNNFPLR